MGDVVPYRSPRDRERTTAYVGMVVFIGAWAMMFACLFFAYGALRISLGAWPPAGQPALPLLVPLMNTGVIMASSVALEAGLLGLRHGRPSRLVPGLALTIVFGLVFIGLQAVVGLDLHAEGLRLSSGAYGSIIYGMASVHAAHVLVGLAAFVWLLAQAMKGRYTTPQHLPVRLWSIYWHFVGVVWVLMFVSMFLS